MTLGEFIKQYREQHELSVRSFASKVGMSPQQILNIEKGIGNNGKPMQSNITTYNKIAKGIGIDELDLFYLLNDNVRVNPSEYTKNMPIVMVDGHPMLDLSDLDYEQIVAISLLLQADQAALSSASHEAESLVSSQQVLDGQQ